MPLADESSTSVKNKDCQIFCCRIDSELTNRGAVKIGNRKEIVARAVLDFSCRITGLHCIRLCVKPMSHHRGENLAKPGRNAILKIDHSDAAIMRMADILLGNIVANEMRFRFSLLRGNSQQSGPTFRQGELSALHIGQRNLVNFATFEIGGMRD